MGSDLQGIMDLWLWFLYFLPVSGSLKVLPEVQLDAEWGGSITIECPLPRIPVRMYLCRQMTDPRICTTVVSGSFVKKEYERRVTLTPCLDENLFLVEMTQLTENDNGIYACGVGINTDRGKTRKITLNVHNAPRTEAPSVRQPSSIMPVTRHPRVSRTSSITTAEFPALPPATAAPKTSAQEAVGPLEDSYSHHTRPHRQRTPHHDPQYGRQDRGFHISTPEFHILIPTFLGFLLLLLLGVMVKRAIQRRKAFSRRRLAMRMRGGRETSRPLRAQRLGVPQRPRSQNNIYSACPRRAPGPDSVGSPEAPLLSIPASVSSAQPQVLEAPWPQTPSLKMSCEYVSLGQQPAVNEEDADSDDYVNIPGLPHLPTMPQGPDLHANESCLSADF